MRSTKACANCKYCNESKCTRKRKEIKGKARVHAYSGTILPVYNISWDSCPNYWDEREDRNWIMSLIYGKRCGLEGIYHEI